MTRSPMQSHSMPKLNRFRGRFARWSRLWLERLESRDVPSSVITAFAPRFSRNDTGDIAIIGNTLITAPAGAAGDAARNGTGGSLNNNDFNMVHVDVDSDTGTFNSSRATLNMPSGASVLWAGLYWGADSNNAARNQVKFQTPTAGAYVNLTGVVVGASGGDYHAFADVTSLVQISGNGVYTAANVQATVNQSDKQAGWGLVVVYRDPTAVPRNLTVFDGFVLVNTNNPSTISTTISGFTTPLAGAVNAKVGFITYEGDLGFNGDFCQLNGTTLSDGLNPSTNFFNSTVSNLGVASSGRTPNYVNQMGFDADIVNAPGIIANNVNSATVTVGTSNETYFPSVITTAIDIYAPVFVSPKTYVDLNGGDINPGDILEYTVTVQNTGGDNATLSMLTDPIPSYTTYVANSLQIVTGANIGPKSDTSGNDQAEFDAVNNRVVFRLGTGANGTTGGVMAIGDSSQVRFRVQVAANVPNNTPIINQATATGKGQIAGLVVSAASAAAAATITSPDAGLHLEKSVDNPQPNVGETVTFTLTLTNQGPAVTNGVVVHDQLPAGLTFVSATGTGSYSNVTGDWTIGTVLASGVATLTVRAAVTSPIAAVNTATITASSAPDPNPNDNSASSSVTPQRSDLGVVKSIDNIAPNIGDIITYTIALTNFGPDAANNVVINDFLPAGVTFLSATTPNGTYNPINGNWTVGTLANSGATTLTIRAQATSTTPASNIATITGATQYDPNPSNNSSTASFSPQVADLSLVKIVNNATPVRNEIITFTLTVSNAGPSSATNVRVSDLLPPGFQYVSSTPSQGTYDSSTNIWTVGTLASGVSRGLTLQVRVIDAAPSTNQASATSSQFDPNPGNNTANSNVTPQTADIDVDKQVSSTGPNIGDTISYSISVTNHGPNDTTGVYVDDVLPSGVTFVQAITGQGSYDNTTGRWTVGNLANGGVANLILIVTVTSPSAIINTATGGSDQYDPIPGNNSTQSVIAVAQANLGLVKSVDISTPNLGDIVTFTVTLSNAGPNAATSPTVYDPLPSGLEFVSSSATSGVYDPATGVWQLPNLLSAGSATLTLAARVLGPGAPVNTAMVSAPEFDPDPSNNKATATVTPRSIASGYVYDDRNNNGIRDVGEPGIGGVTVRLRDAGNVVVATVVTDAFGAYTISGIAPGTYSIVETQPTGYTDGLDAAGSAGGTVGNDTISAINITAGSTLTGYTFGEHPIAPTVTIGNTVATEGAFEVFALSLSNISSAAIVIDLTASGGTATSGTDYLANNFSYSLDGGLSWIPGAGPNGTQATIPAGSTGIHVRVTTQSDTIDEPNETFNLSGVLVSGSVTAINSGTATILDDDPAPTITIGNGSANEGSPVVFNVNMSNASSTAIVIDLTATSGSATAVTDFATINFEYSTNGGVTWLPGAGPTGTRVTVPAGSTSIQARVASVQDLFFESDETFTLAGSVFSGAVTAINSGVGTIVNDDAAPTVTISNGSNQEAQRIVFGLALSGPSFTPIVLDLTASSGTATAGTDFTAINFEYSTDGGTIWLPGGGPNATQVTFPTGSTAIQVRVATTSDNIDEPNETFTLTGSAVVGSISSINTATGTIIDDDPAPTITIAPGSAQEGLSVVFNLSLSNPSSAPIVLDMTASSGTATAGTDFATTNFEYSTDGGTTWLPGGGPNATRVTVPANSTAIQVRVASTSDTIDEPNETFTLSGLLFSGTITSINTATGTIVDDDPAPTITVGNGSATEGSPVVFNLSLSNLSSAAIVLDMAATSGTAIAGTDFAMTNFEYSTNGGMTWLPGTGPNGTRVTVPANSNGIQVRVASTSDTIDEPNETFTLSGVLFSGTITSMNSATGTIVDDDPAPTITIGNGSANEGSPVVFSMSLSNPSSTAIVLDLSTSAGTATSVTDYTPDNFQYSTDGGTTWLPGGGANATQVTIPAGSTAIQVRVTSISDNVDEPNETFTLTGAPLSGSITSINTATGTIVDDDPAPTITIAPGSSQEGLPVVFNLSLSNPSSAPIVLDMTASSGTATAGTDFATTNFEYSINGGVTWLPGGGPNGTRVTVPAGSTAIQVRVASNSDNIDEPNETFTLSGTLVSGSITSINTATGTIIDDDPAPTITIGPGNNLEGLPIVFGLSLSNPSSTAIVIDLTTSGGTATSVADYTPDNFQYSTNGGITWLPGGGPNATQVTIAAGSTSLLVRVATTADNNFEPNETFILSGTPVSGAISGVNPGLGTIIDDDSAPTINIGPGSVQEGLPVIFTLTMTNPSSTATVIDLTASSGTATAGTDFATTNLEYSLNGGVTWLPGGGANGTEVTFPVGSTAIQVRVATTSDNTDEPNENFTLSGVLVSGTVAGINSGIGTIVDDDPAPTVSIGPGNNLEGLPITFNLGLSNPSSSAIILNLVATGVTATAGTDYPTTNYEYSLNSGTTWLPGSGPNGTQVTVPAGTTDILVRVPTTADNIFEPNETFSLSATPVTGAISGVNPGLGTIIDDDPAPTVTIANSSTTEGQLAVFAVSMSNPSSTATVIDLTANSGTATANVDFATINFEYSTNGGTTWLPGGGLNGTQVTVPALSTAIQVRVATTSDNIDEPNEDFTLSGTPVSGTVAAINAGTGTIVDDDPAPAITIGNTSTNEGQPAVFALTLSNPSSTPIVLDLTASGGTASAGTDFATTSFEYSTDGGTTWLPGGGLNGTQVTVPALSTAIQVRVATTADTIDEPSENFTLTGAPFSGAITAVGTGMATIVDDDPAPTITISNATADEGLPLVFDMTLSNASSSAIVIDLTATPGTALVGSDYSASNFEYSTDGGTTWLPGGGVNGTQVTVPTLSTAIRVRIATTQDTLYEPTETFTLSGNVSSGAASIANSATATIVDDDPAPASIAGEVFYDANGNGQHDAAERGIAGVTITLTGTEDLGQPVNRSMITGPSGTFIFTGLRPGNYRLTETQPINFANGPITLGSQGGVAGTNEIDFVLQPGAFGVGNAFAATLAANRLGNKEQLLASTPVYGAVLSGFNLDSLSTTPSFANAISTTLLGPVNPVRLVATGTGAGATPHVRVFDYSMGAERFSFFAYDASFHGGVRVAVGDVNGDGTDDIITGPGAGGGPHVRVFSGVNGQLLTEFMAFTPTFAGGIYVAAGDINNDGTAEIIVGAGEGGGPHVRVFNLSGGIVTENFVFTPSFSGGVRVASGDVNNDGFADIIAAAGPGGGPHVRVYSAGVMTPLHEFFAYDASYHGGVSVAAGDVNGDGAVDIITAPSFGGGPHVKAFSGLDLSVLATFYAFSPTFYGGINVAARDTNGDGKADIIVAPATTLPSYIRVIDVASGNDLDAFLGYGPAFRGGVFVG